MKKKYYSYEESYYKDRTVIPKLHMIKYVHFLSKASKSNIMWLDVGCSLGHFVREIVDAGSNGYGIDFSYHALRNAQLEIKNRIEQASITKLPFRDMIFDVVSVIDVIEHIHPTQTQDSVSEIYRVLKPSGLLILTTPNPCFVGDWIDDLTHINVRPQKYWRSTMSEIGFQVKGGYVPSFIKYYLNRKVPIPDSVAFWLEKPLRYMIGYYYNRKGRSYFLAKK